MSNKYQLVKKYYDDGLWDINRVKRAVVKEWITSKEYETIVGEPYEE